MPGTTYETEQVLIDGRVVRSFKYLHPSLRAFWLASVKAYRDKPYVVYEQQRLTYNELHERASRLASVFRQQYHVHKGDRGGQSSPTTFSANAGSPRPRQSLSLCVTALNGS